MIRDVLWGLAMQIRVGRDTRRRELTFSQLLQRIATDETLTRNKRHDIATNIRVFIRLTGADASTDQASFANCRDLSASFSPTANQVKPEYWTTIRSGVSFAIRRYVSRGWPERLPPFSRGWRVLLNNSNDDRAVTHGLSRFMRFCTVARISPGQVTNQSVERYRSYLIDHSLVESPHSVYRRTIRNWNWATRHVVGWPAQKLKVPRRDAYILPWTHFPKSFRVDGERWKRCVIEAHPLDPRAPRAAITQETAERRLRYLRAFASGMVHGGVPADRIKVLSDLAVPTHFRKGVTFFWNRAGKRPSPFQYEAYSVIKYMSQYWASAEPGTVAMISKAAGRCRCKSTGITQKALKILQQFDDPLRRERLLQTPKLLVGLAQKMSKPKLAALTVQRALAIELLLVAPIRMKNLGGLRLDRHFILTRDGRRRDLRVVIPREEVKNIVPLDFPLPAETIELFGLYVRRYRPVLLGKRRSSALFPGSIDGHIHPTGLSSAVTRSIQRYTGVLMHVHAFRHLAAKLFLERHPHRYDLVALLLGHRSIETTRKYYCALEMQAVSREYSAEIVGRAAAVSSPLIGSGQPRTPAIGQVPIFQAGPIPAGAFGRAPIQLHRADPLRHQQLGDH